MKETCSVNENIIIFKHFDLSKNVNRVAEIKGVFSYFWICQPSYPGIFPLYHENLKQCRIQLVHGISSMPLLSHLENWLLNGMQCN